VAPRAPLVVGVSTALTALPDQKQILQAESLNLIETNRWQRSGEKGVMNHPFKDTLTARQVQERYLNTDTIVMVRSDVDVKK
jgi:hypothetical protein